ncbi:hypothetical protein CONLIGDRAFT_689887 [Coniochaeta ligniaria NRRL 30616]|uniref:Nucleoporin Nup159/Nup146 N-terminal domain-containing protein n=1 Tax=Coniochaeta ligniaria NRRL 30616 TaxID=1408157 RepID=A0A1J7K5D7_9PEZI|nr:hypothetical protein CONLIGDRAFT_689887 [Coniochaeta ligniaria NRRL 30616]
MAFSFGNSGNAAGAGGQPEDKLETIQTEGLGFLSVAGDAKLQLTPRWSTPPAPTASLMSIASRKGLVAAAGQDALYIATTEAVRKAFEAAKGESDIRPFQPQMTVPVPARISQLAFTADEQFLIMSAESGGGLAVYEVQALSQGSTQPAFELSTSGESIRQLVPNPMPELSAFCAIVTTNGNLLMANLQERSLVSGENGPVLRNQVTCASWSTKGKQLVAGRADGTVNQMTPDGTDKGQIPKPPALGDFHVESITWIENNVFLVIHQVTNGQDKPVYHIITRKQQAGAAPTFIFQIITDPVEPFVSEKIPHHTVLRLHHFPPNLDDLLIVASTAIQDIGLLSRSKTPLTSDKSAEAITNVFTTTELADDSRRAQLPMTEDLQDTFPVGVALDLSGKDKVYKPIPADEMDESPGPLPGLWVLSNEGVLCAWWIVYNESIRAGTVYPGLATTPLALGTSAAAAATPAFGGPVLRAKPNPWGAATPGSSGAAPAFGASSFGSAPAAPALKFGTPSLGSSPFGAKPAAPAFGQPSTALGSTPSPWAAGSTATATPAFGKSGFGAAGGANTGKVFGSSTPAASGGFSAFASKPGFGSVAASTSNTSSVFGQSSGAPIKEVSMDTETAFPPPGAKPQGGSTFGSPFVLGTTFKADPKTANDNEPEKKSAGGSFFGGGFGLSLNEPAKALPSNEAKDEDMDATTPAVEKPKSTFESATPALEKPKSIFDSTTPAAEKPKSIFASSTTPTTTPAPPKFGFPTTSGQPAGSSIFGASKPTTSPAVNPFASKQATSPAVNPFASKPATSPAVNPFAPKPFANPFAPSAPSRSTEPLSPESEESWTSSEIKDEEDDNDKENLANIPEAPLPPDPTSKPPYPFGGSTSSSARSEYSPVTVSKTSSKATDDAPLPPDFLAKPSKAKDVAGAEDAPLPPDFTKTPAKVPEEAPLPPDFLPKGPSQDMPSAIPAAPDSPEDGEFTEEEEGDEEDDGDEEAGDVEDEEEEDEEGDEGEEEEDEDGTEGSGIDVAKDLSPPGSGLGGHTPGFTPQGSFSGMGGSTFSSYDKTEGEKSRRDKSRPLFGEMFGEISKNAPPLFPKPEPPSPRSPSPVRSTIPTGRGAIPPNLLRPEASRSVSAPGMASQILGRKGLPSQPQPQTYAQSQSSFQKLGKSSILLDPNVDQLRKMRAKREEEEAQLLRDPEDEGIQQILQSEIEPTLRIDEFVAVDSQLPEISSREKEPVHIQCEALWRDINRMIDRIGLNSRALQAFIKGHTTFYKASDRTKDDLDNPDSWVLVEAEDLGVLVEGDLTRELEEGRVKNVEETKDTIREILRDVTKLRSKQEDMHKIIMAHVDPEQASIIKSLPLNAEQATQQNELRKAYANVTRLLSEAEESLTLLRAKIASAGGASNRNTGAPTVEAVIRTINKLTTMAEKRSVDVDVLETQMRKLRVSTASPAPRSREGSPFVGGTPSHRRSLLMSPGTNLRESFASSAASYGARGTPPRKKMSMFTEEERKALQSRQGKRKAKLGMLREALERVGPQVSTLQDDD